jgi:hypothetical protein
MPPTLLLRLQAIAHRAAPRADAEDALQDLLLDVWMRGSRWHEGRIVLHLKSILRNQRRASAARAAREALYVATQRGGTAGSLAQSTRNAGHPSAGPISCAKIAKSRRPLQKTASKLEVVRGDEA